MVMANHDVAGAGDVADDDDDAQVKNMTVDRRLECLQQANKKFARGVFQDTTMPPWAKQAIDDLGDISRRRWTYSHLLQGFKTAVAPEWTDDIAFWMIDTADAFQMWAFARGCLQA